MNLYETIKKNLVNRYPSSHVYEYYPSEKEAKKVADEIKRDGKYVVEEIFPCGEEYGIWVHSKKDEEVCKRKNKIKESDSSFDVEGLADRIDILMSDMDPYEHMDVYSSYKPTEESYQDTLDSLYNNPQAVLDSISSYDIIDWEDDIQTEYHEVIQDLKEWIGLSKKNEAEEPSEKGYYVLIKMKNNKQVLHLFNAEDEMYEYLNLLAHYVGQGEVEILDYSGKNSKKNESEYVVYTTSEIAPGEYKTDVYGEYGSSDQAEDVVAELKAQGINATMSLDSIKEAENESDDLYTEGTYKIVITMDVSKGDVELDGEETYRTANARPIDTIVKECYTNALPTGDRRWKECVENGWGIMAFPFIPHHITCYSDLECTSELGLLDEVASKQWDEVNTKYHDDYWSGVSYDISQGVNIYDMDGNQVVGLNEAEGNKLSPEELVKSAYEHITSDLGEEATVEAVLNDIMNNYDQDYFKGETPEDSKNDFDSVRAYLRRLGLHYKDLDESEQESGSDKRLAYFEDSLTGFGEEVPEELTYKWTKKDVKNWIESVMDKTKGLYSLDKDCVELLWNYQHELYKKVRREMRESVQMNKYLVTVNLDGKDKTVETTASSEDQAKKQVCDSLKVPISVVVKVEDKGSVIKESETSNITYLDGDTILDDLGSDYECITAMYDALGVNTDEEFFSETVIEDADYGNLYMKSIDGISAWILSKDGKTVVCIGRDSTNIPIVYFDNEVVTESDEDVDTDYKVDTRNLNLTNHGWHNNSDIVYGRVALLPKDKGSKLMPGHYDIIYFCETGDLFIFKLGIDVRTAVDYLYNYGSDAYDWVKWNGRRIQLDNIYDVLNEDKLKDVPKEQRDAIERAVNNAYYNEEPFALDKVNYQ